MKRLVITFLIGIFGINFIGCAPLLVAAIQNHRANAVDTDCGKFQGQLIGEAVLVYGVPNASFPLSENEKLYEWDKIGGSSINQYGNVYTAKCRIQFKTDIKDSITSCQYIGDCGR